MKRELTIGMVSFLLFNTLIVASAQQTIPTERKVYVMGTNIPQADVQKIISALPDRATVKPDKPRRLLIFDLNVNYGGHLSSAYANVAFKLMGEKTEAFEAIVSSDINVFKKESLFKYDAVFFNNNVGNLFEDAELRQNIVEFVYSGGGLMGVHGTSVAFTKWPGAIEDWQEFGIMLGARGANHRENTEPVVSKIEDPTHPLVQVFKGDSFEFKDEYFRFPDVYSRERVRVLLSIDTNKTDLSRGNNIYRGSIRKDNDYAVAWVRSYGKGRVFYSTIAHNPYVFYDHIMLRFYLDAAQFVLGDLKAPTTPSARLDSRNIVFEKVNWQVGIMDNSAVSIEKICKQAYNDKVLFGGIRYGMQVFDDSGVKFSLSMTSKEREKYRLMLDRYCIRINSCRLDKIPMNEQEVDNLFEFLDLMGIEYVILPDMEYDFKTIEKYCQKYGLKAAVECLNNKVNEKKLLATIKNYGEQIGAALAINQKSLQNKSAEKTADLFKMQVFVFEFVTNGVESQDKLESVLKRVKTDGAGKYTLLLDCNGESRNKSGEIVKTLEKVAKELSNRK